MSIPDSSWGRTRFDVERELAEANARADRAERRERELREALLVAVMRYHNGWLHLSRPPFTLDACTIRECVESRAILAATSTDEPRAGQPPQTEYDIPLASIEGVDDELLAWLESDDDQQAPPTARAEPGGG